MEFLIKRTDGAWFSVHRNHFNEVLRPKTIRSTPSPGWGDYRISIPNGEIAFSFEEQGLQIMFEKYSGTKEEAVTIIKEILVNIRSLTGERGVIIDL